MLTKLKEIYRTRNSIEIEECRQVDMLLRHKVSGEICFPMYELFSLNINDFITSELRSVN